MLRKAASGGSRHGEEAARVLHLHQMQRYLQQNLKVTTVLVKIVFNCLYSKRLVKSVLLSVISV